MKLFIANLAYSVRQIDLRALFEPFGTVTEASVARDKESGESRGFGFVALSDPEDALRAIDELDQTEAYGRKLTVQESRAKVVR